MEMNMGQLENGLGISVFVYFISLQISKRIYLSKEF